MIDFGGIVAIMSSMILTVVNIGGTLHSDQVINSKTAQVACPVINYHSVKATEEGDMSWSTTGEKLEEDICQLLDAGYTFISSADFYKAQAEGTDLPEKPVILTFDDGYENNYTVAYPILKKYNVKADIFVVTDYMGVTPAGGTPHFGWEEAKEMEESGLVDIYLHGKNHMSALMQQRSAFLKQYIQGMEEIVDHLGPREVAAYCFPGGDYTGEAVSDITQAGSQLQFIWAGSEKSAIKDKGYMLREAIHYEDDALEKTEQCRQYIADRLQPQS